MFEFTYIYLGDVCHKILVARDFDRGFWLIFGFPAWNRSCYWRMRPPLLDCRAPLSIGLRCIFIRVIVEILKVFV